MTHTTIARRLAALDDQEPTPLFIREGRAYRATAYGLDRVAVAEEMEALDFTANRIKKRSGIGLSGPISLSIPQAVFQYLLQDAIRDFVTDYPDIELTVTGSDRVVDLDRGEADVVIRGQAAPSDHLVGRQICTVAVSHYAHADYLKQTDPSERAWIMGSFAPEWLSRSPYPDAPIRYVIHDIQSRFLALKSGHGLSRAACFMADPDPDLIRLDSHPAEPLYGLWVLTHPDLRSSPKIKALMEAMSEGLRCQRDLIEGNLTPA